MIVMAGENAVPKPQSQRSLYRMHIPPAHGNITAMTNALADRVQQRLDALGKSAREISLRIGDNPDYVRNILRGKSTKPSYDKLAALAAELETSPDWLTAASDSPASVLKTDVRPAAAPIPRHVEMAKDVPVLGTAAGSHLRGAFQIESSIIDYVRRPPSLTTARDIYALYVEGTSMEPQFHPGDLVYIHPHKPPRIGDAIVVQARNTEYDPVEATIGIFMGRTAEHVSIGKHNPVAKVDLQRQFVVAIHKVLTNNELYGI